MKFMKLVLEWNIQWGSNICSSKSSVVQAVLRMRVEFVKPALHFLRNVFRIVNFLTGYMLNQQSKKVKWSRYRPGVAQRVGRSSALLLHDRGTRRRWVVSSTPQLHFTPEKEPVPILQEAGWAPGPVWNDGKSRPHRDSIPYRPVRSQLLYWLSYPVHKTNKIS